MKYFIKSVAFQTPFEFEYASCPKSTQYNARLRFR